MSDVQSFMKKTVQLESHAKVNLMLRVLRRRKDGYHDIKTIFQKISLHDTLWFALKRTGGVSIVDKRSRPSYRRRQPRASSCPVGSQQVRLQGWNCGKDQEEESRLPRVSVAEAVTRQRR